MPPLGGVGYPLHSRDGEAGDRGEGWRAWHELISGGSTHGGGNAAAWCCGGREEQLVPRQRARVLFCCAAGS